VPIWGEDVWVSDDGHGALSINPHPMDRGGGDVIDLTTWSRYGGHHNGNTVAIPRDSLPALIAALQRIVEES